jgi:hypothetical protein
MNFIFQLFIFLFVIFIYLHIRFQLKTVNDLEIYEIDYVDNPNLQEICDIRLPVIFSAPAAAAKINPAAFSKHQTAHDVNIYDVADNATAAVATPVKLGFTAAHNLITADKNSQFYSCQNSDFLEETDLAAAQYEKNDSIWKPSLTAQTKYDFIFGSRGAIMPLTYHVDFRRFFHVLRGQITIKLTYWKSEKWLSPAAGDYSSVNAWNPQDEYKENYEKVKFMDVVVPAGRVVYIPPYWWYSIKFTQKQNDETVVASYSYRTYANLLAIMPRIIMLNLSGRGGGAAAQPPAIKNETNNSIDLPQEDAGAEATTPTTSEIAPPPPI